MKKLKLKYCLLGGMLLIFIGCRPGEGDPLATELAFEKLAGTWSPAESEAIVIDGVDHSKNFIGFTLSFTKGGYTTTNGGDLLSASGMWEWASATGEQIRLDDGKEVTIIELTETSFVFSFFFDGNGGIAHGIGGLYTLTVGK